MRSRGIRSSVGWVLLAGALGAGCASAPASEPASANLSPAPQFAARTFDGLDAALWIETSEEARRLRESVYFVAGRALADGVVDETRSALDQGASAAGLPPAAVLDLDETVLDNAPYNAGLTVRGERFDLESWAAWVEAAEAEAVPGALDFAREAARLGVALFYVSNRDAPMEAATRRNLSALGFALDPERDTVLLRGERPEWRSDKSSRYAEIARDFRVVVLIGDDLNDFLSGARGASLAERRALAEPHAERFGRDWFILPNPIHGSWLRAVLAGESATDASGDESARKLKALRVFPPPDPR